jgi:hypothetical protein
MHASEGIFCIAESLGSMVTFESPYSTRPIPVKLGLGVADDW